MKAIIYTKYGPPKVLKLKEVEKPTPKDNEVLIRIYATAVTSGDVRLRNATFGLRFYSFRADLRLKPRKISFLDAEYVQFKFPISMYYLDIKKTNAYFLDFRCRTELGPPANNRTPLFFPEIGYLYTNNGWYIGNEQNSYHTLLVDGI